MKKVLFGNNIEVDCSYCANYFEDEEGFYCQKDRVIKNGRCKKFDYNPTLRVPKGDLPLMQFNKEDFEI
ncbi:MAG: hypothetical protein J1E96_02805 [Ruminococcus sp.]|nr:hypothetical protein [Ruminococcus sp.]